MTVDIGSALRMVREAKDLKLSVVAKTANISSPFLTLIERGQRQPSLMVLHKLANALQVPVEALILASQPENGSFRSTDDRANRIVESVERLKNLQDELKRELDARHAEAT